MGSPTRSGEAGRAAEIEGRGPHWVTFEGLDGSGKSSHLRAVSKRLTDAGVRHRVTHEPGGTPLAEAISKDLKKRGFRFVGPTIVYAFMQSTRWSLTMPTACMKA